MHLRPKFLLPVGELYFDTQLLYNLYLRNRIHGVCAGISFGYRMDYVNVRVGYGIRLAAVMDMSKHSTENGIFEPHNLLYYVEVFARPACSKWNLSACVTNVTDFQMERMFTPSFMLNAYVDVHDRWRLRISAACKPVGMSNLTPSFYGADARLGVDYRF